MRVNWIIFNGKKILYSDYRNLKPDEMLKQLDEETKIILNSPGNVLYLGNFENTTITSEFMTKGKQVGKSTKHLVDKSAFVGITGLKSMLQNAFSMFTGIQAKAFSNENDAKDYLIK